MLRLLAIAGLLLGANAPDAGPTGSMEDVFDGEMARHQRAAMRRRHYHKALRPQSRASSNRRSSAARPPGNETTHGGVQRCQLDDDPQAVTVVVEASRRPVYSMADKVPDQGGRVGLLMMLLPCAEAGSGSVVDWLRGWFGRPVAFGLGGPGS